MQELDDHQLLAAYVTEHSGPAFAELVSRYLNLVYSTGLRGTSDAHAAEEIAQAVFIILARKAPSLGRKTVLSGWLYHTTRLTAANHLRTERRRQQREQEAYMQSIANENPGDDLAWQQIAPLLDDALAKLGPADRDAVVMRYLENKSAREIATALCLKPATAHKRVERAVGKLRKFFLKRGVTLSAAAIAGAVTANSVQAAPVALGQTISTIAITQGATASTSTLTLVKGAMKLMAWYKAQTTIIAGAILLVVAAATTVTVAQVEEAHQHKNYSWEVTNIDFQTLYKTPPQVVITPTKFESLPFPKMSSDGSRGIVGIDMPLADIVQVTYRQDKLHTVGTADLPTGKYDVFAKLVNMPARDTNWTTVLRQEIRRQFGVTGRMEMIDTNVLVLQPAAGGTHGFKVSHSKPHGLAMLTGPGRYSFYEQPVSTLIGPLEKHFQLPVVNQSGLAGKYEFSLTWAEPDPNSPDPEGMRQALHDQLGLDLVATNLPIEMLVVEKAR